MARILLVEDDKAVGLSLSEALIGDGHEVMWKATVKEGMGAAQSEHPQLIILDVRLPDGSGLDLCRQIRQAGMHQPVLILTAQVDEIDRVVGLEIGADDYITKPFSLREMLSRVRAHMRRTYGEYAVAESERIIVGDVMIDTTRAKVIRGDQSVEMSPIEYRMLLYLARHRGQALTRAQIVQEVWGYDDDLETEKTVNVYIRRLREKLESDPSTPRLILTVPGIGYRLAEDGL